jgi:DNA-binding response OmpR family regulator
MTAYQVSKNGQLAQFGEISFDFRKMELYRADQPVALTLQEFKVLKFFVSRPGLVVSRQMLITAIWPKRKRSSARTVDNHIAKLRQKLEKDPAHPSYFRTVHGIGYKFVPQERPRDSHLGQTAPLVPASEAAEIGIVKSYSPRG